FDIVHSSHVLEHLNRADTEATLDEWVRVLAADGELRMVVPNIKWAAERIVDGEINHRVLNVLYGAQDNPADFHHMGFTAKMVEEMLRARGFKHQLFELIGYNICVKATRKDLSVKEAEPEKESVAGA